MRPLDFLRSIKLKLGVVIVAAVAVTVVVVSLGERAGLSPVVTGLVAGALALALVQVLAHGMTSPLREMVTAASLMARGDYSRRVTATSRDEVGELARAFNAMAAELEQVDRMRRDLVANASHELRTPIGALQARLENLVDGVEKPDDATLDDLLAQTVRLGNVVHQLLDLSKLESGTAPLDRSRIRAGDLLDAVAGDWCAHAAERDVHLTVDAGRSNPALDIDEHRLRSALGNLVANAIRHSPAGGTVVLEVDARDDRTVLAVADDGPGIDPDEAERVFERFYRSDAARSAEDGGAGLGLAIARWTIELHGGSVAVDSAVRNGCRMVVELPR